MSDFYWQNGKGNSDETMIAFDYYLLLTQCLYDRRLIIIGWINLDAIISPFLMGYCLLDFQLICPAGILGWFTLGFDLSLDDNQ